jgi:hypothetical protein
LENFGRIAWFPVLCQAGLGKWDCRVSSNSPWDSMLHPLDLHILTKGIFCSSRSNMLLFYLFEHLLWRSSSKNWNVTVCWNHFGLSLYQCSNVLRKVPDSFLNVC